MSGHMSVRMSGHMSVHMSVDMSVHMSVDMSMHVSIHTSAHMSVHMSCKNKKIKIKYLFFDTHAVHCTKDLPHTQVSSHMCLRLIVHWNILEAT